ncbi:MAG: pseudouridine synthase [Alphaproteobacteria bacterium]|nr:pseudouridine synthase [Alphaproteobacteria bacterium]
MDNKEDKQRINKFLAHAGVCSRRDAERMIEDGRVWIDGKRITTPATFVTANSRVTVDGKHVQEAGQTRVWRYYKPTGCITTHYDPQDRYTVFQDIESYNLPRVVSVGRLDINSEGLLLLTNDGEFSRHAELPSTGWKRCYKVRVFGLLDMRALESLKSGITIDDVNYGSIDVSVQDSQPRGLNHWLMMTLSEGKNREIRKIMNHLGLQVSRLIRSSYGPFSLDPLSPHEVQEIPSDLVQKSFSHK